MRTHTLALVALMAVGCGGADFEGVWRGTLTQPTQCSNGASGVRKFDMELSGRQDGDAVTLAGNTSCGIIRATANGDTATIAPITCQPLVADGITYTDTILGGTLEVNAQLSTTLRGASSGLCTGPMSGILVRGE